MTHKSILTAEAEGALITDELQAHKASDGDFLRSLAIKLNLLGTEKPEHALPEWEMDRLCRIAYHIKS